MTASPQERQDHFDRRMEQATERLNGLPKAFQAFYIRWVSVVALAGRTSRHGEALLLIEEFITSLEQLARGPAQLQDLPLLVPEKSFGPDQSKWSGH